MSNYNYLERKAYGLAAAQVFCYGDEYADMDWFQVYERIVDSVNVDDTLPEGISVWHPFEHTPMSQVMEHIDNEAHSIKEMLVSVGKTMVAGLELWSQDNGFDIPGPDEKAAERHISALCDLGEQKDA